MDDAHINATLHSLYWRAGGRNTASVTGMLRRIVDDGSNLQRLPGFPADFEDIVLALLARDSVMPDEEFRQDLLELSCEAGYGKLAACLLAGGLALTTENAALCMAIALRHSHVALFDILLDAGVSVHGSDASGTPALSHAIAAGNSVLIERLIASGANSDAQGHALATAAIHDNAELLQICLAQGASQQALDDAFGMAVAARQPGAMSTLLDAGASAEAALRQARHQGNEDAAVLIRAVLFAQGRYDQLLSLDEIGAAALALKPPAALDKMP